MKKQFLTAIFIVTFAVGLVVFSFTYLQAQKQQQEMREDLERRTLLLAESLQETVEPYVNTLDSEQLQRVVERFTDRGRLLGLIIYDTTQNSIAISSGLSADEIPVKPLVTTTMEKDETSSDILQSKQRKSYYVLSIPLHSGQSTSGSLVLVQDATFIDEAIRTIWIDSILRFVSYSLLISVLLFFIINKFFTRPLTKLADSLRDIRSGKTDLNDHQELDTFFQPILHEVSHIRRNIIEAQGNASFEARQRLEKIDTPWTAERLKEFATDILKGRAFYVVSNREPYMHTKKDGTISYIQPASGMVTAIDPLMEACGGTWVAHGSGNADREVVDKHDKVAVPPDDPKYFIKRVWLTEEEEKGYYYGFSNDGLWPLCHSAFVEPVFRKTDWEEYERVNEKFAKVILEELKDVEKPVIFIQDYHFTLLPKLLKKERPDITIALFWHIPWPSAESFRICPWKKEILLGMLGADLLAFHTQLHCNNFLDTVRKELEALIDLEQFAVQKKGHVSYIKPFPISIPFPEENMMTGKMTLSKEERDRFLTDLGVKPTEFIGVGVDRMDYTKGIVERFKAIERFLEKYPEYQGKFTFLQVAPKTRSSVPSYQHFAEKVQMELDRVNARFAKKDWVPIVFNNKHQNRGTIRKIYQSGNICLVTSLHDGMNLVAKEFIVARSDERGVLILSEFTGASRELKEALIINPFDAEQIADSMKKGLEMEEKEQRRRMKRLRRTVKYNNLYRWAADILKSMVSIKP